MGTLLQQGQITKDVLRKVMKPALGRPRLPSPDPQVRPTMQPRDNVYGRPDGEEDVTPSPDEDDGTILMGDQRSLI